MDLPGLRLVQGCEDHYPLEQRITFDQELKQAGARYLVRRVGDERAFQVERKDAGQIVARDHVALGSM